MNIAQFLELFDFVETMGPYCSRGHACRYPLISESPPNPSHFQAVDRQRRHAQC